MIKKLLFLIPCLYLCTSCTVYTEKRSQALSQAVFATKDSVDAGRFDLAEKYGEQATKLAFPPKKKIKIESIYTKPKAPIAPKVEIITKYVPIKVTSNSTVSPVDQPAKVDVPEENVLRIVVPDKFKDATLLVEGSTEWQELMKSKDFAKQREIDYTNLEKLKLAVDKELLRQKEMNDKMVRDLNTLQKKVIEKDLVILKLWVALTLVVAIFLLAIYLRIKGIL